MTRFEKQIIGLVENIIAMTDCGALHKGHEAAGNWRLPCRRCIEQEKLTHEALRVAIHAELVRRHIRAGHDKRDGNRPFRKARVS